MRLVVFSQVIKIRPPVDRGGFETHRARTRRRSRDDTVAGAATATVGYSTTMALSTLRKLLGAQMLRRGDGVLALPDSRRKERLFGQHGGGKRRRASCSAVADRVVVQVVIQVVVHRLVLSPPLNRGEHLSTVYCGRALVLGEGPASVRPDCFSAPRWFRRRSRC